MPIAHSICDAGPCVSNCVGLLRLKRPPLASLASFIYLSFTPRCQHFSYKISPFKLKLNLIPNIQNNNINIKHINKNTPRCQHFSYKISPFKLKLNLIPNIQNNNINIKHINKNTASNKLNKVPPCKIPYEKVALMHQKISWLCSLLYT